MNVFFQFTVALFLLFPYSASTEELPVHIIIAADHSTSMHTSLNIGVQIDAVEQAVERYVDTCSQVRVSYMAWGTNTLPPVTIWLHDAASRADFSEQLQTTLRFKDLHATWHAAAIATAIQHVRRTPAPYSTIIFITDGISEGKVDQQLPERTMLFKIALGYQSVVSYLENDFLPQTGQTVRAANSVALEAKITEVFHSLTDLCLG